MGKSLFGRATALLPPWAQTQIRSPRAWKTIARVWLATWASFVIILPTKSAQTLGNAAFFGFVIALIVPPSMPVQMYIFLIGMIAVGMALGWGIGAAAMKAALTVRNANVTEAEIARATSSGGGGSANIDALFQSALFRGEFLDWKSNVVYLGFLVAGTFFFATVRAYHHKFAPFSVFGAISLDIFCTIGPLFPIAQYTLSTTFFISTGCYIAMALVCLILVFPETMSHVHLGMTCQLLTLAEKYVEGQDKILGQSAEKTKEDVEGKRGPVLANRALRARMLAGLQGLLLRCELVEVEFSWGRWSGSDCKKLEEPLKLLFSRLGGLQAFPRLVANYAAPIPSARSAIWQSMLHSQSQFFVDPDAPPVPKPDLHVSTGGGNPNIVNLNQSTPNLTSMSTLSPGTFSALGLQRFPTRISTKGGHNSHLRNTSQQDRETVNDAALIAQFSGAKAARELTLDATLPRLRALTHPLRDACACALSATRAAVEDVNTRRWFWNSAPRSRPGKKEQEGDSSPQVNVDVEQKLDAAIEALRHERLAFTAQGRLLLAAPFVSAIPSLAVSSTTKALHATPPLRAYVVAATFAAQVVCAADAVLVLAELVRGVCARRRKSRLWAPTHVRALGNWLVGRGKGVEGEEESGGFDEGYGAGAGGVGTGQAKTARAFRKDPDTRPPGNPFQQLMNFFYHAYKWCIGPEALYVWRFVAVSVALWLPAVFRSSAHIYYVEKGVWAMITAQTIMNIYASDTAYNLFTRFIGTAVGMGLGTAIWYMGSGSGTGNAYGIGAAMGVFLVPLSFLRVFAPTHQSMPYLMCNVTIALILGYSWLDSHIFVEDSPGVGWPVAWKRATTVYIGAGAAFIMMLLPPKSGRKAIRKQNASIISDLGSMYALLMTSWINEEEERLTRIRGRFASTSTVFVDLTNTLTNNGNAYGDEKKSNPYGVGAGQKYPPPPTQAHVYVPTWFAEFRKRVIPLAGQLRALHLANENAGWEGSFRGKWPKKEYGRLLDLEGDILAALTQLSSALSHLDPGWRVSLIRETLVLNPDFIAEVMSVFTAVSQSLQSGEPLHQILPASLLDRLLYHHAHATAVQRSQEKDTAQPLSPISDRPLNSNPRQLRRSNSITEVPRPSSAGSQDGFGPYGQGATVQRARSGSNNNLLRSVQAKASMLSVVSNAYTASETVQGGGGEFGYNYNYGGNVDGDREGVREEAIGGMVFYEDRIQDVNFMFFASAVSAVRQVAGCLDELHAVVKDLCGEVPFFGFEGWRNEYEIAVGRRT